MPLPTKEQEYLALALDIERQHGKDGPRYITERIGSAAMQRDQEEIEFWQSIAKQYQTLTKTKNTPIN